MISADFHTETLHHRRYGRIASINRGDRVGSRSSGVGSHALAAPHAKICRNLPGFGDSGRSPGGRLACDVGLLSGPWKSQSLEVGHEQAHCCTRRATARNQIGARTAHRADLPLASGPSDRSARLPLGHARLHRRRKTETQATHSGVRPPDARSGAPPPHLCRRIARWLVRLRAYSTAKQKRILLNDGPSRPTGAGFPPVVGASFLIPTPETAAPPRRRTRAD